jgi:hypothetical protein
VIDERVVLPSHEQHLQTHRGDMAREEEGRGGRGVTNFLLKFDEICLK